MEDKVTKKELDEALIASVLGESAGARSGEGCRVGMVLNRIHDEKPDVFETFQHLLGRKDAQHKAIANALNEMAKRMATNHEVPLVVNGATVARHRGDVANPCHCAEVFPWMTS